MVLSQIIISCAALFFAGACAHYFGECNRLKEIVKKMKEAEELEQIKREERRARRRKRKAIDPIHTDTGADPANAE